MYAAAFGTAWMFLAGMDLRHLSRLSLRARSTRRFTARRSEAAGSTARSRPACGWILVLPPPLLPRVPFRTPPAHPGPGARPRAGGGPAARRVARVLMAGDRPAVLAQSDPVDGFACGGTRGRALDRDFRTRPDRLRGGGSSSQATRLPVRSRPRPGSNLASSGAGSFPRCSGSRC